MPYTPPSTVTGSDVLTAALWNSQIRDNFESVAKPYSCRALRGTTLTIGAGVPNTSIEWTATDEWDFTGMHNPASNASRISILEAGIYAASSFFMLVSNGSVFYWNAAIWRFNSANVYQATVAQWYEGVPTNPGIMVNLGGFTYAAAGDYLTVNISTVAGSGSACTAVPLAGAYNSFTVHQVSKQS